MLHMMHTTPPPPSSTYSQLRSSVFQLDFIEVERKMSFFFIFAKQKTVWRAGDDGWLPRICGA